MKHEPKRAGVAERGGSNTNEALTGRHNLSRPVRAFFFISCLPRLAPWAFLLCAFSAGVEHTRPLLNFGRFGL
jgi:hypothetical protein